MLVLLLLLFLSNSAISKDLKFPQDFEFGVATAAYQIEGGWNEDGKGENIWDRLTHFHPDWISDRTNGDIACDSYHKYKEDISLLKNLGVNFYRFSLSWSRLLPSGYTNYINQKGVDYYNNVINELLLNNIEPMVTLYHWDLPEPLQELGGWPNEKLVEIYEDYARFAFETFGDRVKKWITFNEPPEVCQAAYGQQDTAPAYSIDGIGPYACGRTLLLSHAKAYRIYDKEFRMTQKGQVGITIDANWFEPVTNSSKDVELARRCMQMDTGWWAHPIFSKEGDYPEIMKERIDNNSKEESFPRSRLQPFTPQEVTLIKGTFDFFGLNHYSSRMVNSSLLPTGPRPSYQWDRGTSPYLDPNWPGSAAPWLKEYPNGFRKLLNFIREEYGNPDLYVTENGFADHGELEDTKRIHYLEVYLKALLKALVLDGCNIKGYTLWSLMDNFEWRQGYTQRFGLYQVDFSSSNRTRTPKNSVDFYKYVIKNRTFPNSSVEIKHHL